MFTYKGERTKRSVYEFAATTTTRKKKLDNLTRDCLAAERQGVSYGQYKAQHPHTKVAREEPAEADGLQRKVCPECGETFINTGPRTRKFCSDYCRNNAAVKAAYARKKAKREAAKC